MKAREPKISEKRSPFLEFADALHAQLNELHQLAAQGEWEQLDLVAPGFETTMIAFRATPIPSKLDASDIQILRNIEQLLQNAAKLCADRREQIQPLVTAFNTNSPPINLP